MFWLRNKKINFFITGTHSYLSGTHSYLEALQEVVSLAPTWGPVLCPGGEPELFPNNDAHVYLVEGVGRRGLGLEQ